jgi:hypothetical protein
MKAYFWSGGMALRILDLGTIWGEWSASRPGRFTSRKTVPGTRWIGGSVGPRADQDAVVRGKISSPYQDSNPRSSSP